MKELELLGKHCRDIVSGFEGICIGVVEWMYGCSQFVLQPKSEYGTKRMYSSFYFEKQLEVLDEGIAGKVDVPEYRPGILRERMQGQSHRRRGYVHRTGGMVVQLRPVCAGDPAGGHGKGIKTCMAG